MVESSLTTFVRDRQFAKDEGRNLKTHIALIKSHAKDISALEQTHPPKSQAASFKTSLAKFILAARNFQDSEKTLAEYHTRFSNSLRQDRQAAAQREMAMDDGELEVTDLDATKDPGFTSAECDSLLQYVSVAEKKKLNIAAADNDPHMQEFEQFQVTDDINDDDDIVQVATEKTIDAYKCPLSMMILEEPVKGPCGHHYSKQYAVQHFKRYPTACPVVGCPQKFTSKQLVSDDDLAATIKLKLAQAEKDKKALESTREYTQIN